MKKWFNLRFHQMFKPFDKKFNLVILGAQKCGTTSLHQALSQHPEVFMSHPIKEPGYFLPYEFIQKYYGQKGLKVKSKDQFLKKYLIKGYRGETVFGESSTFYTTQKWSSINLAESMLKYNSEMKIIYLYRNRVDRIISQFFHELNKNEALRFEEFLQNKEAFGISCYYQRIKPFIEIFKREHVLIIEFETLIRQYTESMTLIFKFLGLDESITYRHFPQLNARKVQSQFDVNMLKQQIYEHERYEALLRDEVLFDEIKHV